MANSFWNFVTQMVPGTVARADDVNVNLQGVANGFTLVETAIESGITVTNETGITDISANAASRALKVVSFDANGDVIASTTVGVWYGDHVETFGQTYLPRDIIKDAAGSLGQDNIYICITGHVSSAGGLADDAAYWDLMIDVEQTAAYAASAAASESACAILYDDFDDRYLGPKASAPTVDNDGNTILVGALYFNTTDDKMYVRNSSNAWQTVAAFAVDVAVADSGGYFTGGNVESVLQEIGVDTRWISVTQPVDLDAIESQLGTNTSKLSGIESGATQDQTAAQIKTAYESNAQTNAFDDTEQSKLAGIEDNATADQTAGQIKTAYESNADTNEFSDAEKTSLGTMEDNADVTDTANVTAAGALMDSEVDADIKTLNLPASTTITAFSQTVLDDTSASAWRATLDVAQAGTGGMTDAQVKTAYEANANTNEFNDAEKTKLGTVETDADKTDATNVAAAGALMAADVDTDITSLSLPPLTIISSWVQSLLADTSGAQARQTLGLEIGADVQAYSSVLASTTAPFTTTLDSKLDSIEDNADVTDTANVTSAGALMDSEVDVDLKTFSLPSNTTISTFGKSLVDDAAASNARSTLGLVIGTDVQAHDSVLDNTTASFLTADENKLDGIEDGADKTDTANVSSAGALMESEIDVDLKTFSVPSNTTITTFGKSLVNDNDAAGGRSTLGVDPAGTVNYSHPNHSGHVSSSGDGATTLLVAAITGQTNTSSLTGTDEILVNDGGAIRRADLNVLMKLVYPIGCIFLSTVATNPGTYMAGTTWEAYGEGRTIIGTGGAFPTAEVTGGTADAAVVTHTHTIDHDHPSTSSGNPDLNHSHTIYHTHTVPRSTTGGNNAMTNSGASTTTSTTTSNVSTASSGTVSSWHTHATNPPSYSGSSGNAGASGTDKNLPPYIVTYMWKRTA
jgi:hypothetical protein